MPKNRARKQPSNETEDPAVESALLFKTENEWMAARLLGKKDIVEQLVEEAYRGATSYGRPQTKRDLIDSVESVPRSFIECVHSERAIDLVGSVAISTGVATLTSPTRRHSYRYLRVYAKKQGKWRLIASQSTPFSAH